MALSSTLWALRRCYHRAPVPLNILFASEVEDGGVWLPQLKQALPQDTFVLSPSEDVDVALSRRHRKAPSRRSSG
jgi:hypothetical protein